MIIRNAIRCGTEKLRSAGIESPAREAGVILCFVIKRSKVFLYSHDEGELTEGELQTFLALVDKRAARMPLQYIIGHQEFMSLDFSVNPDVLIPRQDTEVLVETVISWCRSRVPTEAGNCTSQVRILDIGTGSGCIAVSLAYYLENSRITAADISQKALETALHNAEKACADTRIEFVRSNLFSGLQGHGLYDAIISNPPYIPTGDLDGLQPEVRCFEPFTALDGGRDGLGFYRRIADGAVSFLKPGGLLAFEVGFDQAEAVSHLLTGMHFTVRKVRDLAGIERVVAGQLL
jgi:release factor glutamine methyltransferase